MSASRRGAQGESVKSKKSCTEKLSKLYNTPEKERKDFTTKMLTLFEFSLRKTRR
jgi:hypothetical protein